MQPCCCGLFNVEGGIALRYDRDDETEILIRVLSFGPMLRVTSPESFIDKIRERLVKQRALNK